MRLELIVLLIASVAIDAYNMRGTDDASLDHSTRELRFRRRYPRRRKDELTVFLVEDDNRKRTQRCTDYLADELYDCVDVLITDTDRDADWGDYVYYIDDDTDCDDALDDIEDDIGCTTGYRRYRYNGAFRRYKYDRNRWWKSHRDDDDEKSKKDDKKSKKDDDDDDDNDRTHRNRWWNRNRDDDGDNDKRSKYWNRNRNYNGDDGKKDKQDKNDGDSGRGYRQPDNDRRENNPRNEDDDTDPPRQHGNYGRGDPH